MAKKTSNRTIIAEYNQRIKGEVQKVSVRLTRKGNELYCEDGTLYTPNGNETFKEV